MFYNFSLPQIEAEDCDDGPFRPRCSLQTPATSSVSLQELELLDCLECPSSPHFDSSIQLSSLLSSIQLSESRQIKQIPRKFHLPKVCAS